VEVSEGSTTTDKSDMGFLDQNAISLLRSIGRNYLITMEGNQHIGIRDAKVRTLCGDT
jgi:hypothetical protein